MTRVKRKTSSARSVAARADKRRSMRKAHARTGSLLDHAMALLPFGEVALHRLFVGLILAAAVAAAAVAASVAGLPHIAARRVATLSRAAGFSVRRVEVRGTRQLNELKIYQRVLAERDAAMSDVDVAALRADIMQLSWVEDARVSRQLPDTLVVDVVERHPRAALRTTDAAGHAHYVLIDAGGHPLEAISPARAHARLIVAGDGVGSEVAALATLLDTAPAMKPQVAEADWVGNRRWNLVFKTGQILDLPEGGRESAAALVTFARLDGTNRLLGGRATAFDMRAADRMYIRIPNHAAASAAPASAEHE